MSKYDTLTHTLVASIGAAASFTVAYPANKSADDYLGGSDHFLVTNSVRTLFAANGDIAVVFGATNITVTLLAGAALSNGAKVYLNLDLGDVDSTTLLANPASMGELTLVRILLGAPVTAVAAGVCASQALNAGAIGAINGTLAVSGIATLSQPRNIVAAWTGAAILTVTGTDEYDKVVKESSASGTSFTGKKAFKTVTKVEVSANVTGLTVGTGNVLGLPVFIADAVDILKEIVNAAVPGTAGVVAAGVNATQTATTGDVRGTYAPNTAPNGATVYELIAAVRAPAYRGIPQFSA